MTDKSSGFQAAYFNSSSDSVFSSIFVTPLLPSISLILDCIFSLILLLWVYSRKEPWFGLIRPEINRFSLHFFFIKRFSTLLVSSSNAVIIVILLDLTYYISLNESINWIIRQLNNDDIRTLQIIISKSNLRLRAIHKSRGGETLRVSPSSAPLLKGNDTCPICITNIQQHRAHPSLSGSSLHPRQHFSALSKRSGVFIIHKTICGHNYHQVCIEKLKKPVCPLCKSSLDVATEISLPYLPW